MTKALTTTSGAQAALDTVETDPRLLMAAKAIQLMAGTNDDGTPKITADMALAAAMYQAGTGQLLGRDFYVNERIGRMEGYRGVARDAVDRGIGDVQIKYRPLTVEEAAEHEIEPGDTATVCEVYQLRAWRQAQRMGQRYEPITGVGVIRKIEKHISHEWKKSSSGKSYKAELPEAQWKPLRLEGGMTWMKKAHNRAYKEALRHVPGGYASGDEVIQEAALQGLTGLPPEAAHLTVEQAQEWVETHGSGQDWVGIEGEYTETTEPGEELPFEMDAKSAIEWAMEFAPQVWPTDKDGVIVRPAVANSLAKLSKQGLTGDDLGRAWVAKVNDKLATFEAAQASETTEDSDEPLFS